MNICMRLVHYVLIQGLGLTNDWDRTAHDDSSFVSCTHLRNISHMTDTRHFRRAPSRGWIPACCTWIWEWQRCELSLQERVGVRGGQLCVHACMRSPCMRSPPARAPDLSFPFVARPPPEASRPPP